MIRRYVDYMKDNPEGYWFKRKLYGWGWVPVSWQGWLVTAVYIVLILAFASTVDENSPPQELLFMFILPLAILSITLLRIAYKTGEKPRWQWGLPKDK